MGWSGWGRLLSGGRQGWQRQRRRRQRRRRRRDHLFERPTTAAGRSKRSGKRGRLLLPAGGHGLGGKDSNRGVASFDSVNDAAAGSNWSRRRRQDVDRGRRARLVPNGTDPRNTAPVTRPPIAALHPLLAVAPPLPHPAQVPGCREEQRTRKSAAPPAPASANFLQRPVHSAALDAPAAVPSASSGRADFGPSGSGSRKQEDVPKYFGLDPEEGSSSPQPDPSCVTLFHFYTTV